MKFLLIILAVFAVVAFAKISDDVVRELSLKGNSADIFIEFEEQVDFYKVTKNGLKATELDETTQGRFVLSELMGTAMVSQQTVKNFLVKNNIKFTHYGNLLLCRCTLQRILLCTKFYASIYMNMVLKNMFIIFF